MLSNYHDAQTIEIPAKMERWLKPSPRPVSITDLSDALPGGLPYH